jgi:glutaredoxin 3
MTAPTVTMYTTATCPYCVQAERYLKAKGVDAIEFIRVDLDPAMRRTMMERTGRRTVPQIYIDAFHVGGYEDLVALDRRGGLVPLLAPAAQ